MRRKYVRAVDVQINDETHEFNIEDYNVECVRNRKLKKLIEKYYVVDTKIFLKETLGPSYSLSNMFPKRYGSNTPMMFTVLKPKQSKLYILFKNERDYVKWKLKN